MPEPIPEVANVLACSLIDAVSACGAEQARFMAIGSKGHRALVVVTTTDRATDTVQDFLDSLIERGVTRSDAINQLERLGLLEDDRG